MDIATILRGFEVAMVLIAVVAAIGIPIFTITMAICNYDAIIVWFIKRFQIRTCEAAIYIAASIEQTPEAWHVSSHYVSCAAIHTEILMISKLSLQVKTKSGEWTPNVFEKKIIWDAAQYRSKSYIKKSIITNIRTERQNLALKHTKITDVV